MIKRIVKKLINKRFRRINAITKYGVVFKERAFKIHEHGIYHMEYSQKAYVHMST